MGEHTMSQVKPVFKGGGVFPVGILGKGTSTDLDIHDSFFDLTHEKMDGQLISHQKMESKQYVPLCLIIYTCYMFFALIGSMHNVQM